MWTQEEKAHAAKMEQYAKRLAVAAERIADALTKRCPISSDKSAIVD